MRKSTKKRIPITHVSSKWLKTRALLDDPTMVQYVPDTKRMTAETLSSMLNRYGMVYVKPVSGTFGIGVMKVEKINGVYRYQAGETQRSFASFASMYESILRIKRKRPYLVQRGIRLLTYQKRKFDIRVMVQRSPEGQWIATGVIGRLGHPKKIVTNYHSGGKPMPISTLLKPHLRPREIERLETILKQVGMRSALALKRKYAGIAMVGADIGVDKSFHPWIIELNTHPDPYIFKHLKKPKVYHRILRYARASGAIPFQVRKK